MTRVLIGIPGGDYEHADRCHWILHQWASLHLRGKPGITGKIVGPRYKGQKVNIAMASPGWLKSRGWSAHLEVFFTDYDVFHYLRDCDLTEGAEMKTG